MDSRLQVVLTELFCAAEHSIYIGDAPSDGKAAKAAGMQSIGVTWGSFAIAKMAPHFDAVVSSYGNVDIV